MLCFYVTDTLEENTNEKTHCNNGFVFWKYAQQQNELYNQVLQLEREKVCDITEMIIS